MLPRFLIRSTGFPVDLLDGLRMPASAQCGMLLVTLQANVDRLQAGFATRIFPQVLQTEQRRGAPRDAFREWYALNQLVRTGKTCPVARRTALATRLAELGPWIDTWNESLAATAATRVQLDTLVDQELRAARERLQAIVADPKIQEALLLSNPEIYAVAVPSYLKHFQADVRTAKVRYLERQFFAYLQRFCAKNDTTSFFGPIDYGEFAPHSADTLSLEPWPAGTHPPRLTRLTHWAAQALADTLAADARVQPYLTPRLAAGYQLLSPGEVLIATTDQRLALTPVASQLLARIVRADGERSMRAICADSAIDDAPAVLDGLRRRGLVTLDVQIPTSAFDPLDWLLTEVKRLPPECTSRGSWLAHLQRIRVRLERFTGASPATKLQLLRELEEQFQALTGLAPRRGHGNAYADRLVLYDEAQGEIARCTVGAPLLDSALARLRPILDLCASYSLVIQDVCRRQARALFMELGDGRPLPYLQFTRAVEARLSLDACLADAAVVAFRDRLNGLAREREHGGEVRLSVDDLQPFLRPVPRGSLISPDIFLAATDPERVQAGDYDLVVGEIHYGAQVWCHFLTFDQERPSVEAELAELLASSDDGRMRACLVHRRQQGKAFYLELPGTSIEVRGRSTRPRASVLAVADLEVAATVDGLELRSRSRDRTLELYPGDPRAVSNWLFGTPPILPPPIRLGPISPRVRIGDATLWRASWQLPVSDLTPPIAHPTSSDLLAHACALRQRLGLPERCFARVASERKPLFVDFSNVFSLELLLATARDDTTVELTEVLPTIDRWWLRRPEGAHSCEWRTTLVACPTPA